MESLQVKRGRKVPAPENGMNDVAMFVCVVWLLGVIVWLTYMIPFM